MENAPWYAHITNFLATGELPTGWKFFFAKIHSCYWEEPFLYKYCVDQIIRRCVPEREQQGILSYCHESACGGHSASHKTTMKEIQSGFYWPSLFKDAHTICSECDKCQRLGKISRCHMMPMNPILVVDLFDVWGIDFMGPFPSSFGYVYILVGVDYVLTWVEVVPCRAADHRVVLKFLKENIFSRFRVPKAIIFSDPRPRPDPIGRSESKSRERPFNSFYLHLITFSFSKVSRPESPARLEGQIRTGARFTLTFSIVLSKHFLNVISP